MLSPEFAEEQERYIASMHTLLAEYHRKLAKQASLSVVRDYHADLAQRFADEAVQIPRRFETITRMNKRTDH